MDLIEVMLVAPSGFHESQQTMRAFSTGLLAWTDLLQLISFHDQAISVTVSKRTILNL